MTSTPSGPVLVPVDFSPHSEAALAWAGDFARRFEISVVVLHVIHDPVENPGSYLKLDGKADDAGKVALLPIEDAARKGVMTFLQEAAKRNPKLGDVDQLDVRLVAGVPETRILEVAESLEARLIVMGSEGKTGFGHLMEGSSAEHVMRLSPVPVTIVKVPPQEAEKGED